MTGHVFPDAGEATIAIVGIACRYPGGATSPELLWRLLCEGRDAVVDVPPDRWEIDRFYHPDHRQPGRMVLKQGGFIGEVDVFDARFFGISPREVQQMDPQQRLLLETTWEALEDAGIAADGLAGTDTGVFVGISSNDYYSLQVTEEQAEEIDMHSATGGAMSIAANRISFAYDLRGPSLSIDTACSSSLVATHCAAESIRRGECRLAVVAGVNLILNTHFTTSLSQAGMLSPRWRSRAFDAAADGYVRGEGVGVVILKPLADALRAGDRIHAVLRGTAVNQDGHTPGLTMPSAEAQQRNILAACARAGVRPDEVGYVEAHGTGTPVGDPIEAEGLGTAFGQGRPEERPLLIGSIKSQIGHLESAAGVAGLIKASLVVSHGMIPRSLHFETPSPRIPMVELKLRVTDHLQAFPPGRRLAGVNSFGFGGTNAHALVEAPPSPAVTSPPRPPPWILPLASRNPDALGTLAARFAERIEEAPDPGRVCAAAARRRDHQGARHAVVAADRDGLVAALREDRRAPAGGVGTQRVVFAFCGQGAQWWAMGRELLAESPVFAAEVARCAQAMHAAGFDDLLAELTASEESSRVQRTEVLQPTVFAVQMGLAAVWRAWGIEPDAVVGHSVGEFAAACISGAMSLEDAARVVVHRARVQAKADPAGGMAYVALPSDQALAWARRFGADVHIGAYNSPRTCTLAGGRALLEQVVEALQAEGTFARLVRVNCACHTDHMDPLREELYAGLEGLRPQASRIPMYSTVTGRRVDGSTLDADYWWENFRRPVAFGQAVEALVQDGHDTFLELSPHPLLVGPIREALGERPGVVLPSLLREKPERVQMLMALATLYVRGADVRWEGVYPGVAPAESLPHQPWIHERFWGERAASRARRVGRGDHPLLERRLPTSLPTWQGRLDRPSLSWIGDHVIQGEVVVPGAVYLEMALAAARIDVGGDARLEEVEFRRVLVLPERPPRVIEVALSPTDRSFQVRSRAVGEDGNWVEHAVGRYAPQGTSRPFPVDLAAIRGRVGQPFDLEQVFTTLVERGYAYGPTFRGLKALSGDQGRYLGRVEVPAALASDVDAYHLHPAVLDACLQVMLALALQDDVRRTFLPVGVRRLELFAPLRYPLHVTTTLHSAERDEFLMDVVLVDDAGQRLANISGLRAKAVSEDRRAAYDLREHLYQARWVTKPRAGEPELPPQEFYPPLSALADHLQSRERALYAELERERWYVDFLPRMDALAAGYAQRAVRELLGPGRLRFGDEVEAQLAPGRRALFRKLLALLESDGLVTRDDDGWRLQESSRAPLDVTWRSILWDHPESVTELELARRCGEALPAILRGERNPLEVLFPDGTLGISAGFYQDAPGSRIYNLLLRSATRQLVERLPAGRRLRVLEIGAGTGGLTTHLVGALSAEEAEYVFTDLSPQFFAKARERFDRHGFLDYRILDIDRDPLEQGFAEGAFDLVVASDAVHATPDLRRSLRHARRLLAPGGLFFLIEATPPSRLLDQIFGMTDGWWLFADTDLRVDSPLAPVEVWERALRDAGFVGVEAVSERPSRGQSAQAILLARAPETKAPPAVDVVPDGRWMIFADRDGLGAALARRLRARDVPVTLVLEPNVPEHAAAGEPFVRPGEGLFTALPDHVVGLWGVDVPADGELAPGCIEALEVVKQLVATGNAEMPRLWLVTRGAWEGDDPAPARMPLWGIGATIVNELPRLRCTLVDLPAAGDALELLWPELATDDGEREIHLRPGVRRVRRLVHLSPEALTGPAQRDLPVRAVQRQIGSPESLELRRFEHPPLGPQDVRVRVHTASLNFRDLMVTLGFVQQDGELLHGAEGSGHVTEVGADVQEFAPGDRVVFLTRSGGTLATHVTVPTAELHHVPDVLTLEQVGGIPVVYVTALYALRDLARLQVGERVLVHAGSGGLGLALIEVARMLGGEVFATAGSEEKRAFLRALGVRHVMDSRTLDFGDEVRRETNGAGVDVVVNCLSGDAIARSVECLAPYGRFVEVGKRDLMENARIGLRPFLQNLSYFALDIATMHVQRPAVVRRLIAEVLELLGSERLRPIPLRSRPLDEARVALRSMGAARHVGKILLSPIGGSGERALPLSRRLALDPRGAYLVTGGLSGFGLATALRLAERGARQLVLVGRRGRATPEAEAGIAALEGMGVNVEVEAIDVADEHAVALLVSRAHRPDRPLVGVVHAAMVLKDLPVLQLDAASFEQAFAPKARGAWNLHRATLGCPLALFVVFSSASALVGTPGQANYVAANRFLDGLAWHRRARGLPALSVNWGVIEEVGFVARHGSLGRHLDGQGLLGCLPALALDAMEDLLAWGPTQAGVARMDWGRWLGSEREAFAKNPFYERIVATVATAGPVDSGEASAEAGSLSDRIHAQVAKILGLSPAALGRERSLAEVGLDSLLSAEISAWLRKETGAEVSVMNLMKGPSTAALANLVEQQRGGRRGAESGGDGAWSLCFRPERQPNIRLICVPFFGGSPDAFRPLAEIGPGVEVHAVRLPGFPGRTAEPAFTRMEQLVDELANGLAPLLDRPFALYGHSLGAQMAYELALRLEDRSEGRLLGFFPAAFHAPQRPSMFAPFMEWPDSSLQQITDGMILREMNRQWLPEQVITDPSLLRDVMPAMRASILAMARYRPDLSRRLRCPVHALVGITDSMVSLEDMEAWGERTAGRFSAERVPGGHLFVLDEPDALRTRLRAALQALQPAARDA